MILPPPENEITVESIYQKLKIEKKLKVDYLDRNDNNALLSDRELIDQAYLIKKNINPRVYDITSNEITRSQAYANAKKLKMPHIKSKPSRSHQIPRDPVQKSTISSFVSNQAINFSISGIVDSRDGIGGNTSQSHVSESRQTTAPRTYRSTASYGSNNNKMYASATESSLHEVTRVGMSLSALHSLLHPNSSRDAYRTAQSADATSKRSAYSSTKPHTTALTNLHNSSLDQTYQEFKFSKSLHTDSLISGQTNLAMYQERLDLPNQASMYSKSRSKILAPVYFILLDSHGFPHYSCL